MRLVVVHAVLLVSALGFAYQTWTRGELAPAGAATVTLWDVAPEEIVSIAYRTDLEHLILEHRQDDLGSYLWATLGDPQADGRTDEFLVGQPADDLLRGYASLRALRDIGPVDPATAEEYGFTDEPAMLSVTLSDGETRSFLVGGTVFGTGGWYVRDTASERVYVLPAGLIDSFTDAEASLREGYHHRFSLGDVAFVRLQTTDGERTMATAEQRMFGRATWAPADAPDETDQTFTNFMERIQGLRLMEFTPELSPDSLERVLRIDYFDDEDARMGFLELFRDDRGPPPAEYYARSEHTRVLVRIPPDQGEPLDQDVRQLF